MNPPIKDPPHSRGLSLAASEFCLVINILEAVPNTQNSHCLLGHRLGFFLLSPWFPFVFGATWTSKSLNTLEQTFPSRPHRATSVASAAVRGATEPGVDKQKWAGFPECSFSISLENQKRGLFRGFPSQHFEDSQLEHSANWRVQAFIRLSRPLRCIRDSCLGRSLKTKSANRQ